MASSSCTVSTTSPKQSFPVIVNKELLSLINTVKEMDLITTYSEVMEGLRVYILERKLFDPLLPIKIRCCGDPLSSIFGVNEFTIYDVRNLLARLVVPIRISAGTTTPTSSPTNENSLKRKSEESTYEVTKKNCDQESCVAKDPMVLFIPSTPNRDSVESDTAESIQGYETAFVKDTGESDNSISFFEESDTNLQPGDILAVTETFDVEYEVESDSDQEDEIQVTDSGSDSEGAVDTVITFVCKSDSDVEFWADKSSDEEFDSDLEIPESDKWECKRCGSFNNPPMRYCDKCWCMRTGWVAPTREEKRTSSKRKQRTRRSKLNISPDFESTGSCKPGKNSPNSSFGLQFPSILSPTSQNVGKMPSIDMGNVAIPLSYKFNKSFEDLSTNSPYDESLQDFSDKEYSYKSNTKFLEKCKLLYESGSSSQDLSTLSSYSSSQEFPSTSSYSSSQEYPTSNFNSQETLDTHKNINYSLRTPNLSTVPKCESDSKQCLLCCSRPANASIIHGKYAHQISCYRCARKLQNENKRCPVCRRTIERVVHQVSVI